MDTPESFVQGSEKLTRIFGCWPSFHDADVIELHLWRGDLDPDHGRYTFPVVTAKFHLFELTTDLEPGGSLVTRHHTLATLRFHAAEDIRVSAFNYMNSLDDLRIDRRERDRGPSPYFEVEFVSADPAIGMGATFKCRSVEVLDALLCGADGRLVGQ